MDDGFDIPERNKKLEKKHNVMVMNINKHEEVYVCGARGVCVNGFFAIGRTQLKYG